MKVDTRAPFDKVVDLFLRNSIRRNLNTYIFYGNQFEIGKIRLFIWQ